MTAVQRGFLPDGFRPRQPRRRSRRRWILPALGVAALLLAVPMWTVQSVEIRGAEVVPAPVSRSFEGLVGHMIPLLELEWLHQLAAVWPQVSEVRVSLDLPGTVVVEIFPETVRGSVAVGSGWHAVSADGGFAGSIAAPRSPRLEGFQRRADRRGAFAVARRLAEASGCDVEEVHLVTPADYRVEIRLNDGDHVTTVHVTPDGTAAEKQWCENVKTSGGTMEWADLRWPHRMVLRGAA
ncbi:MAG: hypothetical protein V2I67_12265 [Thermoanaerobaculales bacterium]|jgi:hypothetical protein|nr:hypothetical protein [Thermoanaerobaculales bacterium]